jgi:hypothetical protein
MMAFLFLGMLLSACNRPETKSQQPIVGTWIPDNFKGSSMTFNSDGSFLTKMNWNASHSNVFSGTWQIESNILIMTPTNITGTEPHEPVGNVDHLKIIRLDDNKLVYKMDINQTDRFSAHKLTRKW